MGQGVASEAIPPLFEGTSLGRLPLLREVADTAVYAAGGAGAMTGAVLNLSCDTIAD